MKDPLQKMTMTVAPTGIFTLIRLAIAIGGYCAINSCEAHPVIRRWQYEGAIISVRQNASYFVDVRPGDPVHGTIGYDLTSSIVFGFWHDHAPEFQVVTTTVVNPRTGGQSVFPSLYSVGVGVYDDEPESNGHDVIWLLEEIGTPATWPEADFPTASVTLTADQAFSGSALPPELDIDAMIAASLAIDYDSNNEFIAEIHTLTPIDVPLLPGDFNGDEFVDHRDLGVWEYVYGSEDANLAADGNLDGRVDGADFLVWQRQLGVLPLVQAHSPVPEPESILLAAAFAFVTSIHPRRAAPHRRGWRSGPGRNRNTEKQDRGSGGRGRVPQNAVRPLTGFSVADPVTGQIRRRKSLSASGLEPLTFGFGGGDRIAVVRVRKGRVRNRVTLLEAIDSASPTTQVDYRTCVALQAVL